MKSPKLIFVYNAKSGLANALLDTGKKYISPDKYDCALCMITYGPFGMKKDWKNFVHSLPYKVSFLHRDEFAKEYPSIKIHPPSLIITQKRFTELMQKSDFEKIHSIDELKQKVDEIIKDY